VRPLRLQLKGFTAFRDLVELDFTELDLFAISGPTGSGKSSLLDAMTYALYGRVERVGDQVGQLISHGQPRMAVTLEFEVGREQFRVTRTTSAKRVTKIQLERLVDGEWRQAGEGSDRVREAESMIARTIGLTYDGFTRSVLLPQGKFAEFLVGDPRKRRDILTELLGLELFQRMAKRAGERSRDAEMQAKTMTDMLDREYVDATPEALKGARASAKAAQKRERALAEAAQRVLELLGRWQEAKRSAEEIQSSVEEVTRVVDLTREAAEELGGLIDSLQEAAEAAEGLAAESEAAQKAAEQASTSVQETQAKLGSASDLSRAQGYTRSLAEAMTARETKERKHAEIMGSAGGLGTALEAAKQALAASQQVLVEREVRLAEAEAALERARHGDLVAAVSSGLKVGDPCPVCGVPLAKAPKKAAAGALERATRTRGAASKAFDAAGKTVLQTDRALDGARRDLEANTGEQARLRSDLDDLEARIAIGREAIEAVLGTPLPDDPAAAIEERLGELHRLDRAEREAARAVAQSAQAVLRAEQQRDRVLAEIERRRDRLVVDFQPLLDRAARALGKKVTPTKVSAPPKAREPEALRHHAEQLAVTLTNLSERLWGEFDARSSKERELLEEANREVAGLLEPASTLEDLAEAANIACRSATADMATATQRAEDLAERLRRRKQLAEEVRGLEERKRLFRALALELRADRLIAFLQAEALQVLASAGSERLASLSDGRYRLGCRDDEFYVVDTWNGDEERSVRTLSGGETFLASLSLALALADQVRSLSTTDRARLDSLFLDEGFGTLDQEALDVVRDAIGQLAIDGRLIGVITHVRDLAEQFPRIEVEKSPRGSRLKLVAT
jgi:exonuclease SbcC